MRRNAWSSCALVLLLLYGGCDLFSSKEVTPPPIAENPSPEIAASDLQASRPAAPGCFWEEFEDVANGIILLVQDCSEHPLYRVSSSDLLTEGNNIYTVELAEQGGVRLIQKSIEIFSKDADTPIIEAIEEQFLNVLPAEAKAGCRVVQRSFEWQEGVIGALQDKNKEMYVIEPFGAYKEAGENTDNPFALCGDYGTTNGIVYFEYHPEESNTKFLFVRVGQDYPLFDEQSIRIVSPAISLDWMPPLQL